jgi:hypothetical protein
LLSSFSSTRDACSSQSLPRSWSSQSFFWSWSGFRCRLFIEVKFNSVFFPLYFCVIRSECKMVWRGGDTLREQKDETLCLRQQCHD